MPPMYNTAILLRLNHFSGESKYTATSEVPGRIQGRNGRGKGDFADRDTAERSSCRDQYANRSPERQKSRLKGPLIAIQTHEILFPFAGEHMLLFIVALLAGSNNIALHRSAPANKRHQVVHRKFFSRYPRAAIVAAPFGALSFPPSALPELAGDAPLSLHIL